MKNRILHGVRLAGVLLAALLCASGCASKVQYGDATEVAPLTMDFGSSDLQQIAESMVDSLLAFPPIVAMTENRRPVLTVARVKNKSMQHIDMESVTDSIRNKLIKSGKFQFIDRTTDDAAKEELAIQRDSGLVDPGTAVPFGQQVGAELMLTGNFSEIEQEKGRVKDVYYKFTMVLKNLRTGILEWSEEKEIRKVRTKPGIGR